MGVYQPKSILKMAIVGTNYNLDGLIDSFREDLKDTTGKCVSSFGARLMYNHLNPNPDTALFFKKVRDMWATEPNLTDDELSQISCPTLVMAGDHEEYIKPVHTKKIAKLIPNSQLLLVPGADHEILIKMPKYSNKKIEEFLKKK